MQKWKETVFSNQLGMSLHQDSTDNGVITVNFAVSKNVVLKNTMFPHRNITPAPLLMSSLTTRLITYLIDRRWYSRILDIRVANSDTDHYMVFAKVRERQAVG
jgi:hypothetical protein